MSPALNLIFLYLFFLPPPPPHTFSPVYTCPPARGAPAHLSSGLHLLYQWHGGQPGPAEPQGDGGTAQRCWTSRTNLTHYAVQGLRWWVCVFWVYELNERMRMEKNIYLWLYFNIICKNPVLGVLNSMLSCQYWHVSFHMFTLDMPCLHENADVHIHRLTISARDTLKPFIMFYPSGVWCRVLIYCQASTEEVGDVLQWCCQNVIFCFVTNTVS